MNPLSRSDRKAGMMKRVLRAGPVVALLLVVLTASGCGSGVKVHGHLVMDGKPYEVAPDELSYLIFIRSGGEPKVSCGAIIDRDTFTVEGPEGKGLPPGKYIITFRVTPSVYAINQKKASPGDKFKEAFSKEESTPLSCEITSSTKDVTIDLGKKTATAS